MSTDLELIDALNRCLIAVRSSLPQYALQTSITMFGADKNPRLYSTLKRVANDQSEVAKALQDHIENLRGAPDFEREYAVDPTRFNYNTIEHVVTCSIAVEKDILNVLKDGAGRCGSHPQSVSLLGRAMEVVQRNIAEMEEELKSASVKTA